MAEPEIWEITLSLVSDHLSLSLNLLSESRKYPEDHGMWTYGHLKAMSSILHCFCALDAALNFIGYELFDDSTSSIYIPPPRRDFPLNLMIKNWQTSTFGWNKKLEYILSLHHSELPQVLAEELSECAKMRNFIAHGKSYKETILVDTEIPFMKVVADREVEFDFTVFTRTKMKSPPRVNHEDAYIVNRIILDTLKILADETGERFQIVSIDKGIFITTVGVNFNVENFLQMDLS